MVKLIKAWKQYAAGSLVEVDEATAKTLIAAEVAIAWSAADAARNEEQAQTIKAAIAESLKGLKPTGTNGADESGYKSFGKFLKDVQMRRVKAPCSAEGNNEATDDEGGYLLDTTLSRTLVERAMSRMQLCTNVFRVPIGPGANGIRFNGLQDYDRRSGGHACNVYRIGEACEKTASLPKFERKSMDLEKLCGLFWSTDELLLDEPALEAMITRWFTNEFAWQWDYEALRGSGTGEFLGVLNSAALVEVSRNTAGAVDANDVARMYSRMYPPSIGRAEWFVSSSVLPQLIGMTIGTQPVWTSPAAGLSVAPYGTLFGRPIRVLEQSSALGTIGDIGFFDMAEYMVITKGGIAAASSIHVKFTSDQTVYRFVERSNGMPMWSRAIYPSQGTDEISPWVVLEGSSPTPTPTI